LTNAGCLARGAKNPDLENRGNRKDVISEEELNAILLKASKIENTFYRLRATAVVCLLRLTGKRRGEVTRLSRSDFVRTETHLNVTFELEKKRRGSIRSHRVTKSLPISDPLTPPIIEYLDYLEAQDPKPLFFLPRTYSVFGQATVIDPDNHISGRQVLNIFRGVSDAAWPHLMRETVGAEVVKADPSIIGVFRVKMRLDHEKIETSLAYLSRYATDVIEREGSA
jgi:integrase